MLLICVNMLCNNNNNMFTNAYKIIMGFILSGIMRVYRGRYIGHLILQTAFLLPSLPILLFFGKKSVGRFGSGSDFFFFFLTRNL